MKYQKIYDALQTGGARIDLDQSGWRANSSDNWIASQRPLWLVAEVPRLHLRMWVTHEFGTLSVTTANSALPIDSRAYHESHTRRVFQNQRQMAEYLEELLSRKDGLCHIITVSIRCHKLKHRHHGRAVKGAILVPAIVCAVLGIFQYLLIANGRIISHDCILIRTHCSKINLGCIVKALPLSAPNGFSAYCVVGWCIAPCHLKSGRGICNFRTLIYPLLSFILGCL